MKTFNHGLTDNDSIKEVAAYTKALNNVLDYLTHVTKSRPENRFIDAVPLIEKISDTAREVSFLAADIYAKEANKSNEVINDNKV